MFLFANCELCHRRISEWGECARSPQVRTHRIDFTSSLQFRPPLYLYLRNDPPGDKDPNNWNPGESFDNHIRCCAKMRSRREKIIKKSDHPWRRVSTSVVYDVVGSDLVRRRACIRCVRGGHISCLDNQFSYIALDPL